jgi:hypothetical protein
VITIVRTVKFMVDLGQKGGRNSTFLFYKKSDTKCIAFIIEEAIIVYLFIAYLLETSDQLITLKKASI